jgi:L-threonylcarbamoyladenylate synthase
MKTFSSIDDVAVSDLINFGAVGILPTDTVYGIVCCANKPTTVARLYHLKPRVNKPGTIIASSIDQLVDLGLKRRYLKAVEQFWPGPVSVIIPCSDALNYLHQGRRSLAVRIPSDKKLQELLNKTGPLLTTSANEPDMPGAVNFKEAQAYFNDEVDFYVDGGDMSDRLPSAIIRMIDDEVEVIRPGGQFTV